MIYLSKKKITNFVTIIVILVPIILSGYFYYQLNSVKNEASNVEQKEEVKDLVNKVSRLYLVSTEEEPTVATVSDPAILKNQSFFTLSEKGDKVLIYNKLGKAILYRPSIDKIIEIAPIKNNSINKISDTNNGANIENQDFNIAEEKTN